MSMRLNPIGDAMRATCEMLEPRRLLTGASPSLADADVGSPAVGGSASFNAPSATWTVRGGGSDIWGSSDQFNFASRALAGNGSVVAQVNSVSNSSAWAKAGVMLRDGSAANASFADVVVTPANGVHFQWRPWGGAAPSDIAVNGIVSAPLWVRLDRSGNSFSASFSYDGANWTQIGEPQTVWMNPAAQAGLAVSAVNNSALCTAVFGNVGILPVGWTDQDIGSPAASGAAAFDGSNLTVTGSGYDIWNNYDQFNLAGQDFVGDVSVVARVKSLTNTGSYAKAGVMIRDGLAANASYALLAVTPLGGLGFEYRSGANTNSRSAAWVNGATAPLWLKLVRAGGSLSAFYSFDGAAWTQAGPTVSIAMSPTIRAGVAVDANNNGALNAATFSNVSVLPAGWSDADVGAPAVSGSARFDGINWSVGGGGADVWNNSDQFNLASQTFAGDVTVVAQVNSLLNSANNAKAGVMIRDGTGAGASYAYMFLTPDNGQAWEGANFEFRNGSGTAAQGAGFTNGVSAPRWVKLVRAGNWFTGYFSADDANWTQEGSSHYINMPATAQVGLAVNSNNIGALDTATFSNVSVGAFQTDLFLKQNGRDIRNGHGSGDNVHLRGVNLGGWLMHESWVDPMDGSGLPDDQTARQTLINRFGIATANRLIQSFQDNWITTKDLDNIKAMGMNVVRASFSWLDLVQPDGTWRSDAFTKLDWVVNEAWKRGIYTILDFHAVPGGQNGSETAGLAQGGSGYYWWSQSDQQLTAYIWWRVAQHFKANPAIAAYDLMNEPSGAPSSSALWGAYNQLFWTIRGADPDHLVMMEGTWTGQGANGRYAWWNWDALPNPTQYNWTNVAYEFHAYVFNADGSQPTAAQENQQAWNQYTSFRDHYSYNVPDFIGEFNSAADPNAWNYAIGLYDQNNMSWATWTYKTIGGVQSPWGLYGVNGQWPVYPNLQTDSADTILGDYAQLSSPGRFAINPMLRQVLGMPSAAADAYATRPGQSLYVNPASGVLANDTDPNLGQGAIRLVANLLNDVSHGTLQIWSDGSFSYTPSAGFIGTDTFRYFLTDGHSDSTNIATVSITVA